MIYDENKIKHMRVTLFPGVNEMSKIMNRTDIINKLISNNGYHRYLEIGVKHNINFNEIDIDNKEGVDPAGKCKYPISSDDFFNNLEDSIFYDIIFIDGLHLKDQVLRDINNSLKHLNSGGVIIMHDCSPENEKYTKINRNGTVWEAFVELRMSREDLFMCVVDIDYGCGIIRKGNQKIFPREAIKFALLESKRKEILNLISADEFDEFTDMCKKMENK